MNMRTKVSLGISALMLGGTMVGCAGGNAGIASASDRNRSVAAKSASADAARATKALANRDAIAAIGFAEGAVAMMPAQADYRVLLGQSYLQAGRYSSARQAFADALQLSPDNGKAALNYALAQTATGDWDGARRTLETHTDSIPASDRGLAIALAGDPVGAVAVLTEAARTPGADAKTRQNLALALALSGQWPAARIVAEADISPADVDKRMVEWAAFAQPHSASDQVSAMLGVAPVQDGGQPVALALNAPAAPVAVAEVVKAPLAAPVVTAEPVSVVMATPVPAMMATPPVIAKVSADVGAKPRAARMIRPAIGNFKLAVRPVAMTVPAKGQFFVQLGAYDSPGVARDGWRRATRRYATLGGHVPAGMNITTKAGSFYRLSIGGFARRDADAMCHGYRARGGVCFVRAGAGDQTAQWLRKSGVQLASR